MTLERKTDLDVLSAPKTSDLGELPSLKDEIISGRLILRGDTFARSYFSFSVHDYPIGIFGAKSMGPNALALLRSWNQEKTVVDPINGLTVVNRGRQFNRIHEGDALFLCEYTSDFLAVVSRVAFRARSVRLFDAELPGAPASMRFEAAELRDLEILG